MSLEYICVEKKWLEIFLIECENIKIAEEFLLKIMFVSSFLLKKIPINLG